jgi:predicted protein tyrosine phosphatase
MREKLLFVCSQNKWRSLTAEKLFVGNQQYDVQSAGTERGARIKLTAGLLGWADQIFVMERKHLDRIRQNFPDIVQSKSITVLDITDDYGFMDDELIDILWNRLAPFIDLPDHDTH